jgi:hypothetical protein
VRSAAVGRSPVVPAALLRLTPPRRAAT